MDSIFMSYRRVGASGYGGRLHVGLRNHFGGARVFRDIDSIPPGTDFAEVIEQAVTRSGVVLALIGRDWLTTPDADGRRRIDDPDDFVRLELECAFEHEVVVIPVLVEQARMPASTALPTSLIKLSRTQGIELSDERWDYDVGRLITRLEELVGPGTPVPSGAYPAVGTAEHPALPTVAETIREVEPAAGDDNPPDRGRRQRRKRVIFAVIGSLVMVLVTALTVAAVPPDPPSHRRVPGVVGQEEVAATARLRAEGFVVHINDLVDDNKRAGVVVVQEPPGDITARAGATVILSIARSSGKVPVPRIVNLTRSDAENMLRSAGLVPGPKEVSSDIVAIGMVISQHPDLPAKVDKGSRVEFEVSTGRTPTTLVYRPPTTTAALSSTTTTTTKPTPPSSALAAGSGSSAVGGSVASGSGIATTIPRTTTTIP